MIFDSRLKNLNLKSQWEILPWNLKGRLRKFNYVLSTINYNLNLKFQWEILPWNLKERLRKFN